MLRLRFGVGVTGRARVCLSLVETANEALPLGGILDEVRVRVRYVRFLQNVGEIAPAV